MLILNACTGVFGTTIPSAIPYLVTMIINVIKIVVPILLIIFGMLDLGKAVTGQKEDEIKKGQQLFFKRAVAAVMVFLVVAIVQLFIGVIANSTSDENTDNSNVWSCVNYFINYKK